MPIRSGGRGFLRPVAAPPGALAAAALVCGALATAARPYSDGPPPGHSGGFGEPTCHICHGDLPLNGGPGTLRLAGLPRTYEPGARYTLTLSLNHPGVRRAGFQLTARFLDRESGEAALQAGRLAAADEYATIVQTADPAVQYAQHTEAGSRLELPGHARWTLEWWAPAEEGGRVAFHFVGNAANDDDSEFGDHIYADSMVVDGQARIRRHSHWPRSGSHAPVSPAKTGSRNSAAAR